MIGISGLARSGKDTLANNFSEIIFKRSNFEKIYITNYYFKKFYHENVYKFKNRNIKRICNRTIS